MVTPAKLKIGFVLDDGLEKPDGVQQYILALGEWLNTQGHHVDYLVGETKNTPYKNVYSLSKNIKVNSNGNSMTIPLPTPKKILKTRLDEGRYDILHIQTPFSPFMGGRLVKLASSESSIIGTFHILPNSKFIFLGNWLLGLYCKRTLKKFDRMLAVSNVARDFAQKTNYGYSEVLPNVVDYERFAGAKPIPKYQDEFTILFLGRLVKRKGCITLLQAFNKIVTESRSNKKFKLVICGVGPELKHLQSYVNINGLEKSVEFVGFVSEENKPRYYASADLAVFPSSGGESFGIVLIEAMANPKTAVLAGDNPGYRSVLDSEPEALFKARDYVALADKISEYMNNNSRRHKLADWQSEYTKQFDISVVGSKLVNIYYDALRNRPRR